MDAVQRVDRRGFLAAAAAMLASSHATAQTFISGTPASDVGFDRMPASQVAEPQQPIPSAAHAAPAPAAQAAPPTDWRQLLLAGERSVLVRRDGGPLSRVRYCTSDGMLDRDGYAKLCLLLRDVKAGKLYAMDPRLLDVLCGLQRWGEANGRDAAINLLSGFRTLQTNSALEGAALNSMHLYGRAADIVLEGFSSGLLGAMVRQFNPKGGSGIYLNRGFVHVDTGAARSWVSTESRRRR